ncbi:MAG: GAP family protein [Solirubrobacterales bacterium]
MFGETVGEILPLAVAVAISPLPIAAVILMLLSRNADLNGLAFLAGWVVGLVAVGALVLAFGSASSSDTGEASQTSGIVRIVIGVVFVFLAVRQWRARPRRGKKAQTPGWLARVEDLNPFKSFGAAFLLAAVNPKNLGLTIAAASTIAAAGLTSQDEIGVFAIYLLVACSTIAAPVFYYLLAGERAERGLDNLKSWLITHNATVMAVLLLVIGAKLIGDGIGILS